MESTMDSNGNPYYMKMDFLYELQKDFIKGDFRTAPCQITAIIVRQLEELLDSWQHCLEKAEISGTHDNRQRWI